MGVQRYHKTFLDDLKNIKRKEVQKLAQCRHVQMYSETQMIYNVSSAH